MILIASMKVPSWAQAELKVALEQYSICAEGAITQVRMMVPPKFPQTP